MVSSKNGPSSGSGLSKIARTCRRPRRHQPLDGELAAGDEALDQHRVVQRSFARARMSGDLQSDRSRSNAATSAGSSSARMTPRLPDSASGFTTHGKSTGSSERGIGGEIDRATNQGPAGRPRAAARASRSLLRAIVAAGDGVPGRPSASHARRDDGRPIADRQHAVDRLLDARLARSPRSTRSRRGTGSGSPRPATDPRARCTDRSQTPDPRRAARPLRRTRGSDIRSSSRAAALYASSFSTLSTHVARTPFSVSSLPSASVIPAPSTR